MVPLKASCGDGMVGERREGYAVDVACVGGWWVVVDMLVAVEVSSSSTLSMHWSQMRCD